MSYGLTISGPTTPRAEKSASASFDKRTCVACTSFFDIKLAKKCVQASSFSRSPSRGHTPCSIADESSQLELSGCKRFVVRNNIEQASKAKSLSLLSLVIDRKGYLHEQNRSVRHTKAWKVRVHFAHIRTFIISHAKQGHARVTISCRRIFLYS